MERTTRTYTFDYENDTSINYVNTGKYSMLNCSFTSEDPNYGTDTLHLTSNPALPMAKMAYEYVGKLNEYLNKMDHGFYRDVSAEERRMFGDYSNSTLYAIEKALYDIANEYRARYWFGHCEDVCREIAKRMVNDGNKLFSICLSDEMDWETYSPEEYKDVGSGWFGVRRIMNVFDNEPYEYIVCAGVWGGGCLSTAYVYDDGSEPGNVINNLGRAICDALEKIDDFKPQSVVYAMEEKEDK